MTTEAWLAALLRIRWRVTVRVASSSWFGWVQAVSDALLPDLVAGSLSYFVPLLVHTGVMGRKYVQISCPASKLLSRVKRRVIRIEE